MRVLVPPPLHSYTGGVSDIECPGDSLAEILAELDRRYLGIRFRMIDEQDRIRPHIKIFVDGAIAGAIDESVAGAGEVQIVCALSGG